MLRGVVPFSRMRYVPARAAEWFCVRVTEQHVAGTVEGSTFAIGRSLAF